MKKCLCWFLIDFLFCRLAETAVLGSLHQSCDFLRSDVSLGVINERYNLRNKRASQEKNSEWQEPVRLFIECVCVWSTKSSNHAGLLCCSKL